MENEKFYSLTLRRVRRGTVDVLYNVKWWTERPVYDLVDEALEYWLENAVPDELKTTPLDAIDANESGDRDICTDVVASDGDTT